MEETNKSLLHYSNRVTITISPFDIVMDFKQIIPDTPLDGGKPNMLEGINNKIAMSPQHYKSFLEIAIAQLKKYEEQFGEIVLNIKSQEKDAGK